YPKAKTDVACHFLVSPTTMGAAQNALNRCFKLALLKHTSRKGKSLVGGRRSHTGIRHQFQLDGRANIHDEPDGRIGQPIEHVAVFAPVVDLPTAHLDGALSDLSIRGVSRHHREPSCVEPRFYPTNGKTCTARLNDRGFLELRTAESSHFIVV